MCRGCSDWSLGIGDGSAAGAVARTASRERYGVIRRLTVFDCAFWPSLSRCCRPVVIVIFSWFATTALGAQNKERVERGIEWRRRRQDHCCAYTYGKHYGFG
jgi:hypothetical protein